MSNYASASLNLAWNGIDLSDGLQGAGASKNGDLQEVSFDLKGKMTTSQLANQGGVITATYTQNSETLRKLDTAASGIQKVGANFEVPTQGLLVFEDPVGKTGNFVAWNAVLISTGDEEWGETVGEREVTWACEKLIRHDNPAIVVANIAEYLG